MEILISSFVCSYRREANRLLKAESNCQVSFSKTENKSLVAGHRGALEISLGMGLPLNSQVRAQVAGKILSTNEDRRQARRTCL